MTDNDFFVSFCNKLNNIDEIVKEVLNGIEKIDTELNDLLTNIENGSVTDPKEIAARLRRIRNDEKEISSKGTITTLPKTEILGYDKPKIICEVRENKAIMPTMINIDVANPLYASITKDSVHGMASTLLWLVKHMICVDIEISIVKEGKLEEKELYKNTYNDCIITNLYSTKYTTAGERGFGIIFSVYGKKTESFYLLYDKIPERFDADITVKDVTPADFRTNNKNKEG